MMTSLNPKLFLSILITFWIHQGIIAQNSPIDELNSLLKTVHTKLGATQDLNQQITFLTDKIERAKSPQKQVLQSLLADIYYAYLIENLEALRTQPIIAEVKSNIYTWSGRSLINYSRELYLLSLSEPNELQKIESSDLQVPTKGAQGSIFRPSLYDILSHRALDFFTDPRAILNPAPAEFRMLAQGLIMPPEDFSSALFPILDSLNHTKIGLDIFKQLLGYQLNLESKEALLDTDLRLLKWLRSYASGLDKAGKYVRNLRHLIDTYPKHEALADVQYELALVYVSIAGDFQPLGGQSYKWEYRRAWEICTYSLETYPKSRGAKKCAALLKLIEKPALRIAAEEFNLPNQPFRMQVSYRNLKHLYFRLYDIPSDQEEIFGKLKTGILRWDFAKQFTISSAGDTYLANDGDYQFHRTETAIPSLKPGTYALCVSNQKSFDWEKDLVAVLPIKITHLSGFSNLSTQTRDSIHYYARNRVDGKPAKGIEFSISGTGKTSQIKTTEEGKLSFQRPTIRSDRFDIRTSFEQDSLSERIRISTADSKPYRSKTKTYVFTDRPSYIRGGFISIKGFIRKNLDNDLSLIQDTSLLLRISQEGNIIDSFQVKANPSGIFEAIYPLPLQVQVGKLYVLCGAAYAAINVVEKELTDYEIGINQEQETYTPSDTVRIFGKILGPPEAIWEDADVRYLVSRDVRFPDWADYSWWKPLPHHREVLVKQGKSLLDSAGNFQFQFAARPDPSHPVSQRPVYFYKIRVLATDPEGERLLKTHNLLINHSGKSLQIDAPEQIALDDTLHVAFSVKNLRERPMPFSGKLIIESLVSPKTIYRKRRWLIPDLHLVSEEAYREDFPLDVYGFEDDFRSWALEDTVYLDSVSSASGVFKVALSTKGWKTGMYRVRMLLPFMEEKTLQKRHYFNLYKKQHPISDRAEVFTFELNKKIFQPKDTLELIIKTSLPEITVHYKLVKGRNSIHSGWISSKENEYLLKVPMTDAYTGSLSLEFSYIYQNESVIQRQELTVLNSAPDFELIADTSTDTPTKAKLLLNKENTGPLLAFHSRVPSYTPELSSFSFGISRAAKAQALEPSIRYVEPARAALSTGKSWETPLNFPTYSYPSLANKAENNEQEEQAFRQTVGAVLTFPTNRRSVPPRHRWINLFANVGQDHECAPSWALNRLERELSWKSQPSFYTETLAVGKAFSLRFQKPDIPDSYRTMSLLMDEQGAFSFRSHTQTHQPTHLLLTEHGPMAEASKDKSLIYKILNTSSHTLNLVAHIQLGKEKQEKKLVLKKGDNYSLSKNLALMDQEGVLWSKIRVISNTDTTHRSSPLFVRKQNYTLGRSHLIMEATLRKKRFPLSRRRQEKEIGINASKSPAYYALRALPSLVAHVNYTDPLSLQHSLFSLAILGHLSEKDSSFRSWLKNTYEGHFNLQEIEELSQRLERQLRNCQLTNGAFTESNTLSTLLTREILEVEKDLYSLGIKSSLFQRQSLAFSLHYLDSLYLHPAPEAIIWNTELGKYVALRKSLADYPMEQVWMESWQALQQLHEGEEVKITPPKEVSWILANLFTKEPGPTWQSSIIELLTPDWDNILTEGIHYLKAQGFSFVQKKKHILFKHKPKERVYLELFEKQ